MSGVPPEWTILLFEALQKEVEIIARSREVLHTSEAQRGTQPQQPGAPPQSRRYRLNLDVEELGWVRQRLQRWKENLQQPLIVDIHLVTPPHPHRRGDDMGRGAEPYRDLLERWYLVLEAQPTAGFMADGSSSSMTAKLKRAQKMIACMIRTLYAFLRLTPTYQLVRRLSELAASSSMVGGGSHPPPLGHRVEISIKPGLQNSIRWDMEQLSSDESYTLYRLPDVPTPYGTLRTTAVYRSRCDVDQVGGPAPPARLRIEPNHQIISDYVSDSETSPLPNPSSSPFASSPPKPAAPATSGLGQLLRAYSSEYPSDQRPYPPPPSSHEARSSGSSQPHRAGGGGGGYVVVPPHQRHTTGQLHPRFGRSLSYEGPGSDSSSQHSASLPIPVPPPASLAPDTHAGGQQSPGGGPSSAQHRHHHHHHHHHRAHSSSPPGTVRYPPPPPPSSRWLVSSSSSSTTGPVNIPSGPTPHSYSGSSGGSPYYHHHHRESRASSSSSLSHESPHMMLVGGDAPPLSSAHHRARSLDSATDTTSVLEEHLNRLSLLGRGEEPSSASSGTATEPSPTYDYLRQQQHQQQPHMAPYGSSPARGSTTRGTQPGGQGTPVQCHHPHHSRAASSSAAVPSTSAGSSSSSSTSSFPLGTSPQTSTPTTPKHHPRPPSLSKQGSSSSQPPLPPSLSSLTSTPPFSVSGRGTASAQQPQPATSPFSLGATGLHTAVANMLPTCSPPFRTLNSLLSRSPSQAPAPSFITSSSSASSASSFLAGGGPPPTLGGGGSSSTHLRGPSSFDGISQPHRASLARMGSIGHTTQAGSSGMTAGSSSNPHPPHMPPSSPVAAAAVASGGPPRLDCLGDSPFKQAALGGGSLLQGVDSPLREGSLTGLLSLSRAGPLSARPPSLGLEGSSSSQSASPSLLARRSLACLVAEEDMRDLRRKEVADTHGDDDDDDHDDHDDADLPFAVAPRPGGSSSLMLGLSSTGTSSAAAASSSSSIHQHLVMSGIDSSSTCSTASKAPAARLAEQCLAAPPLRIFGEGSSYHMGSRLMTANSPLRRPDMASGSSISQPPLQGGGRSHGLPPGTPPSSLLGGGGLSASSTARSVRALDDDLRDFQRFRQTLGRSSSSSSSHQPRE